MPDREKIIGHLNDCMEASRRDNTWVFVRKDIVEDAIALLEEQHDTINELQNAYRYLQEQFLEVQDKSLNEQETELCDRCGRVRLKSSRIAEGSEVEMTDRAYVISRALENKIAIAENCDQNTMLVTLGVMKEILVALKEQEAVTPYIDIDEAKCSVCKVKLTRQELIGDDVLFEDFFDYCPRCGKPVKWE